MARRYCRMPELKKCDAPLNDVASVFGQIVRTGGRDQEQSDGE